MNAHFDTREFVNAHGNSPKGRGTWIFQTADRLVTIEAVGKFAAARARVAAANPRQREWVVLP